MYEKILAKATRNSEVTLWEHTKHVLDSAHIIFGKIDKPTRTGRSWMKFFQIDDFNRFMKNLEIAILLHDIGKANSGFQAAIRRQGNQIWRHEHISAFIMLQEQFMEVLKEDYDYEAILSAVISHHFKIDKVKCPFGKLMNESKRIDVLHGSEDVNEILSKVSPVLNSSFIPNTIDIFDDAHKSRDLLAKIDKVNRKRLRKNLGNKMFTLAIRSGLIVSDAAGSAVTRENLDMQNWLDSCFSEELLSGSYIAENIIDAKIRHIENQSGVGFQLRAFQEKTAELGDRALLISACGSGKTFAAWKWIESQLSNAKKQRVIFLYPTRATATEGFKDYASFAGGEIAALKHGTSDFDLQGMFNNPEDFQSQQDYTVTKDMYSLGYWNKKIFAATVDSFLSFMANNYSGITMLPLVADSVIVIDEVHSFDRTMFGALVNFLNNFNAPVLIMTATLSERRKKILTKDCNLEIYPEKIEDFLSLEQLSNMPRYDIQQIESKEDGYAISKEAFENDKCILWVENQVAKCQEIAIRLSEMFGRDNVICYHSRFRLKDRKDRHREAVNRFKEAHRKGRPIVLVTTQVCEMSLDLDADVLITALAPIPSLIQRMGRCNRAAKPGDDKIGQVKIYEPENILPYKKEEIEMAQDFVSQITKPKEAISQKYLSDIMERWSIDKTLSRDAFSAFTSATISAFGEQFRETSSKSNQDCILDSDAEVYIEKHKNKDPLARGYIVPVPKTDRTIEKNYRLPRYLKIARAENYNKKYGYIKPGSENG